MIPKDVIDEIFFSAKIDEVVGDYVTLKKKGADFWACCPFHDEKTPSFSVSPVKGIYKCFGCGEGGNVVDFVMRHDQLTYPEALRQLAEKYNIDTKEETATPEQIAKSNERESQFIITEFAEKFFKDQCHHTDEGKSVALAYLKNRGFSDEIIEKFGVGYSPEAWDSFTQEALKNGYNQKYLLDTGLSKDKNGSLYDGFRGRVIFPIHNVTGKAIGFGARTLRKDKKIPKYLNSPESLIYHKSKVLYGIYQAKRKIAKEDNCYLVEGYTDVMALHQAEVENVVSSSGTSLTEDQIKVIKRYTQNITFLFDGDNAGIKAAFRGIDMVLKQGLNVRIIAFPEGEDPDSFSQQMDPEDFRRYLEENKTDFVVFKTNFLSKGVKNDPILKSKVIHEVVESLALIPDQITRAIYVQECSRLLQIEEQVLLNELNKLRRKKFSRDEPPPPSMEHQPYRIQDELLTVPDDKIDFDVFERDLTRILLRYHDRIISIERGGEFYDVEVGKYIAHEITNDELSFSNVVFQSIWDYFLNCILEEEEFKIETLLRHENDNLRKEVISLVSDKYGLSDWEKRSIIVNTEEMLLKRAVLESMYTFKLKKIEQMILDEEKSIQNDVSDEELNNALKKIVQLKELKRLISLKIGRPI
ncbi:MAG: DNA primase [Flavobacteriales bacterium]|nr:DNA primase [Flavobacteriales bacterium]